MIRRYRLFAVHLLAALLPCAVIGLLGYKWLELEREIAPRRSKEAAEAEAADIRQALKERLAKAAVEVSRDWAERVHTAKPFAEPPLVPEIVESAYLFSGEGRLIYPDYEGAYRRAMVEYQSLSGTAAWQQTAARLLTLEARGQPVQARRLLEDFMPRAQKLGLQPSALLELGRLSLREKQYEDAASWAQKILACCAETRDEYGVSFALYAARQLFTCWEAKGIAPARFPQLAAQLRELLQAGRIGHPTDLPDLSELSRRAGNPPAAAEMLVEAGQRTDRIRKHMENGKRLEKWVSGSAPVGANTSRVTFAILHSGENPQIAGLCRHNRREVLLCLFATDPLAAWVKAHCAERGRFEAFVAQAGKENVDAVLQAILLPEAPGFNLVLQPKELDPALLQRRQMLFVGALIAAVLLVLLVGYFALRDFSREIRLAGMRSNFVAGVTHDLKTPLTAIRMLAETLQLGRVRDAVLTRQMLGTIVNESERLSRLLDNVLSYAKIEKGARSYRLEEIDLPAMVIGAARQFEYVLQQEGFHLSTESDGNELRVNADADALTQALLNLLSNAVKYSGKSREIHLSVRAHGREAEICVRDYGIGIAPSEQHRIFESFYRAPEAARETSGAGLGLALVRHFAEAHGGRITVSSEPGKGSAFSLWLPLLKAPRHSSASPIDSTLQKSLN